MSTRNGLRSYSLKIWRQAGPDKPGNLVDYAVSGIHPDMSFLEMLDQLNQDIVCAGGEPVAFDSDCREGICGTCGIVIDGRPHGPLVNVTACNLRMREFPDGAAIVAEPFRAKAFPIVKDLVIDRSALDRVIQHGGYVSINVGSAAEANQMPIPKDIAEQAMDSAACIGCGACVASCPNASASLFVGAKIRQMMLLPQGKAERTRRVLEMVQQMDAEGFGDCSNHGECEAACPKAITLENIATMRREYVRAALKSGC
ncbi:succinate dehydrogenase/fumarate reductase iron-sulfur subunit [Candidatus Binatia bacterium]|nr:succinate dehydrogenase/fumarate reductase iron-sulfur subunit [Candidatus Binatia bacterium]